MPNFAILRTKKLNSWSAISGSMNHTYRRNDTPNADPVRLGKNKVLIGETNNGETDIRKRLDQITSKPRKNAVLAVECLLTASPEWFADKSEKQIQFWAKKNIEFLQQKFGKDNVIHAVIHRDETTPHIAAYIIPEVSGKLNCRAILGGRDLMKNLQTDYAAAMSSMKLNRGIEGSKAKHTSVKSFYTSINEIEKKAIQNLKNVSKVEQPPAVTMLSLLNKNKRDEDLRKWEKSETDRTKTVVKIAASAVLSTKTLRREVDELKDQNSDLTRDLDVLKQRLTDMYELLSLTKEDVMHLRQINLSTVAERLGYYDEISKKENAIDLVKRINNFDYQQSVAWLHAEFGAAAAVAAVKENLNDQPPARPLTPAEIVIKKQIKAQLKALDCKRYRISIVDSDGIGKPFLPGKQGNEERFYTANEVEDLIPFLRFENNTGKKHILITPIDDDAYYILLDDSKKSLEELEQLGFKPCLFQKTSWDSTQAVFKVPKNTDRRAVIDVFNALNRAFGDEGISGLRHAFRLAGFRNMKPKHERNGQYPFVNVIAAINRYCRKTMDLVAAQQLKISDVKKPAETTKDQAVQLDLNSHFPRR